MNKIILSAFVVALMACTHKPLEADRYRILGEVEGLEDGNIYLAKSPSVMDTIPVKNGKFQLEEALDESVGQIFLIKDPSQRGMTKEGTLSLFVEPKEMKLALDYTDFSKSLLTGSQTQNEQYQLEQITNKIAEDYKVEQAAFEQVNAKYQAARQAGASDEELEAIKYEDNACREKLQPMWEKQQAATLGFIKSNPKSYVSVYSMCFLVGNMKYDEAKPIYDQFNPEHLKIGFAERLTGEIEAMRKGIPGAEAGDFNTTDLSGKPIKLADFTGKYLLIDFWASWCVPCRKGSPHLIELYHKYHEKGLELLGVADDDRNVAAWKKAVEKDQTGLWHHVLRGFVINSETGEMNHENDISDRYNIKSLPTKILVGPDGIILGRFGAGAGSDEDMDKMLNDIFKN